MSDMLQEAQASLFADLESFAAGEVTYRRGSESDAVLATKGSTAAELHDGDGMVLTDEIRDFLINRSTLSLNGVAIEPEEGDEIVETDALGITNVWEVLPLVNNRCWRWSGPHNLRYRIHVKLVYSDAIEQSQSGASSGSGSGSGTGQIVNVEFLELEMAGQEFS